MSKSIPEIDSENSSNKFSEYFKFISVLGNGAFGVVVAAEDKKYGNSVWAVKIIRKNSINMNFVDGLRKEAYILAQFKHPNIVSFKRIIETETQFFLVMECLNGGQLKELIEQRVSSKQCFTEEEASVILQKITSALEYIHSKDIVHRDLKPENILFAEPNDLTTVKIVDFGLSVQYDTEINQSFTEQVGTKIYMAPELFNKMEYSKPVDIWGLGIIMYQLLNNGKHPLYQSGDNLATYTTRIQKREITLPPCSDLAQNLLAKLLAYDPNERYSAVEVLQHPWITRRLSDKIPLTLNDRMKAFYNKQTILRAIKTLAFVRHLQKLNRTVQKPIEIFSESKQNIDSLLNFVIEAAEHTEQPDFKHTRALLPINNSITVDHNSKMSIKSERKINIHLAVPQSFEELIPEVKTKNKGDSSFQLNVPELGAPNIYRSKTSETDDLRSIVQANLKSKAKSPGNVSKDSDSPEFDRNSNNSGERSSHDDKSIGGEKSIKRSKFSYSNLANKILQPAESNSTPMYDSKKSLDFLKESGGVGPRSKLDREKNFQDRSKAIDDYKFEENKPSNRNTSQYKYEEIRALKPEEKDILTDLMGGSRKRETLESSSESSAKLLKTHLEAAPLKGGKKTGFELKIADDPQDPTLYALFDPKNLRNQSSVNNLSVRKLNDDLLNTAPYKRNFHASNFKHAKTPNGTEGRYSSTPQSPKDSKSKQQIQNAGDMVVYAKSNSQEYPTTTGRSFPLKPPQKSNFNELPPSNSRKQIDGKNYKIFK